MSKSEPTLKAVGLSGSPSPNSRSRILLEHTLQQLAAHGPEVELIDLTSLSAEGLLGRRQDAQIDQAVQKSIQAQILLLASPIYRATYSGQLKAFLDLFPQFSLRGVVVGLIATGGGPHHALAIDHGLRPLVASLGGLSAAQALYVTDGQFSDKTQVPEEISKATAALAAELYTIAQALAVAQV